MGPAPNNLNQSAESIQAFISHCYRPNFNMVNVCECVYYTHLTLKPDLSSIGMRCSYLYEQYLLAKYNKKTYLGEIE